MVLSDAAHLLTLDPEGRSKGARDLVVIFLSGRILLYFNG